MKIAKAQSGLTLVEILVVMGMMTVLLAVVTEVFSSIVAVRLESESASAMANDSRYILARLNYDIGRAQTITTPANLGDIANTISFTTSEGVCSYSLSNGRLVYNNATTGTSNMNTSLTAITGLTFQRLGNSGGRETVRISLTIHPTTAGEETTDEVYVTTVGRR